MKSLLATIFVLGTFALAHAAPVEKELSSEAAKKLYSALKVKVEDHDDILNKNLVLKNAGLNIACEKWVVDKAYGCTVTASQAALDFQGSEAKKLYKSLSVKIEDADCTQNKTLEIEGLAVRCEYWVVDEEYSCEVEIR